MNILEYGYYDTASNDSEVKDYVKQALKYQPNTISVLPSYLRCSKNIIKNQCALSTVIDFPYGISPLKSRTYAIEQAIKDGAQIIELVIPNHALCNKKYDKFRQDINIHKDLCDRHNVELRYILDYRIFTEYMLYKIAQMLLAHKIDVIYPSTNLFLDNITDNIIASMMISKKVPYIDVIVNGNAWNDDHISLIMNNPKIYGYKTNNLYTLEKIFYYQLKTPEKSV